jgi:peptide-methionine (S)-S-oxide reductase
VKFYHNEEQKKTAEDYIDLMTKEDTLGSVTKISSSKFYEAEDYHQNYYNDNKTCYCSYIIIPKIEKLKVYKDKLKK